MKILERAALYFHTLRYLRFQQILGRLIFRLYKPEPSLRRAPACRPLAQSWSRPIERFPSLLGEMRWRLLNEEHDIATALDWNAPEISKLWLYNLHYFDDLNAQDAEARHRWHVKLIERWIEENPPGVGVGWEPYPISLRIVNWVKWLLAGRDMDAALVAKIHQSLAVQVRYLMGRLEFHLLGNHLLANAKALVYSGLYFSGGEAERWYARGMQVIERQMEEQILSDGGHFERSPMYHALMLEDLLDLLNLSTSYGKRKPELWGSEVQKMQSWLAAMTHPDGEIAFFNDAAMGVAARAKALAQYAQRIGVDAPATLSGKSVLLAPSGYARFAQGDMVLLADVGPVGPDYLPGHAHADTLSFELSLWGKRVLVNSGTSVYGNSIERQRQRGTAAHNTVRLDRTDSAQVWAGFRVARRPRVQVLRHTRDSLTAIHDGYTRLPGKPKHTRHWTIVDGGVDIVDEMSGQSPHLVEIFLHVHPDGQIELARDGSWCKVFMPDFIAPLNIHLDPALVWRVEQTSWHPEFGATVPSMQLVGASQIEFPFRAVTKLRWQCES